MSESRKKPSESAAVRLVSSEGAEVPHLAPELTEAEQLTETWRSEILRGSAVLSLPPRSWILRGWLPADSLGAIYAPPGVGKSFYALSLSLELALGGEWIEPLGEPRRVLYLAAERSTEIRDRAEAWQAHTGRKIPDTWSLLGPRRAPQLTVPTQVEALERVISDTGAQVVVLDTYARMTLGLEENATGPTGLVLEALDRIRQATSGGIVLAVHHTGKDTSKGLRGSIAFLGAVDFSIEITSTGAGRIRAQVKKSNAGPEPLPEHYSLEPVKLPPNPGESDSRSVAVLVHTGAPAPNPELAGQVLGLWESHLTGAASLSEILEALTDSTGTEPVRAAVKRVLKSLTDSGSLVLSGKNRGARYELPSSPIELL